MKVLHVSLPVECGDRTLANTATGHRLVVQPLHAR
jgi:hypothetical protein